MKQLKNLSPPWTKTTQKRLGRGTRSDQCGLSAVQIRTTGEVVENQMAEVREAPQQGFSLGAGWGAEGSPWRPKQRLARQAWLDDFHG